MLKKLSPLLIASVLTLISLPSLCLAALPSKAASSLSPMLEKATPAVVNITVKEKRPAAASSDKNHPSNPQAEEKESIALGSGVIINAKEGLIVTNAHVIEDEKLIVVSLKNGRRYRATLIGKDKGFDLAVLKIKAAGLVEMPFADSDQLNVGNFVVAIGSPFGLTQTVTSGVISALNRSTPQLENFEDFIQTDAPINMGNSGGALINIEGKLVGINTAIVSPNAGNIGIGFAIPSNRVKSVTAQLIQYGKVSRGVLGVLVQSITPELASAMQLKDSKGAIVTDVVPGTPAAKAHIQIKDVIQSVNGKTVRSSEQLHSMLSLMRPGTHISLRILRKHKQRTLSAIVGDPDKILEQQQTPFIAGMRLQDFTELEPNGTTLKGAVVVTLRDSSDGALAGLIPGDVITRANDQPIQSVKALTAVVKTKPDALLLKVTRGNGSLFLVIQQEK